MSFWPRPELDELIRWTVSERHVAIQLVTGEGGTGKTRLAHQLADELTDLGVRSWWVPAGTEQGAAKTARDAREPVLLVVDYAETRTGLNDLLAEVISETDGPVMRVLLLARSAGEWWQQLISSSGYQLRELLAAVQPITLGPVSDSSHQPEVFSQALAAFADKLKVVCPDAQNPLADPDAAVLVIHTAALLAVLQNASVGSAAGPPRSKAGAMAGLLRHEASYWQQTQAARGLGLDVEVTRRAVAAGCLVGADDETSASELLTAIADLADRAQRGKTARWLRDLYPVKQPTPGQQEWIGSLQPDILAEQLVVEVLDQKPDLIPALFRRLPEKRATRALTILARAARTDPAAEHQLDMALTSDLEHLAVPALTVAVETNPAIGGLIRTALTSAMPSADVIDRIARALPQHSFALADTAAVVFGHLVERSEGDRSQHAYWLVGLSKWLSELGRWEQARAADEEAVSIYRELAQDRPDAFLPELARSLRIQSRSLSALGRREQALAADEEAVSIYRPLAQDRPDAFLPDLAKVLRIQSVSLTELGRREQALAAAEEAVSIYRPLAQDRPDAFLPDLAISLSNQSVSLTELGRREQALAADEEAVSINRPLAQDRPDAFLPDLAISLTNQSRSLSELGRREQALAAAEEAISIYRPLAQDRPDAFLPELARSLSNQSAFLTELGRREQALAADEEAVSINRPLAQDRPDAYLPDLAMSLNNQSVSLTELGRREQALAAAEEAVSIYRPLAQDRPDAFLPDLAMSLNNQSVFLTELGRREQALAADEEAVSIYRELAQDRPDAFLPYLAKSLTNQSRSLWALGRREQALAAAEEAVSINRPLAQDRPDAFLPDLAISLTNQFVSLSALGRREQALAAAEEAVSIYRRLAQDRPDAFLPGLARSLNNWAAVLAAMEREPEAAAARHEAKSLNGET